MNASLFHSIRITLLLFFEITLEEILFCHVDDENRIFIIFRRKRNPEMINGYITLLSEREVNMAWECRGTYYDNIEWVGEDISDPNVLGLAGIAYQNEKMTHEDVKHTLDHYVNIVQKIATRPRYPSCLSDSPTTHRKGYGNTYYRRHPDKIYS